jgi:hypothetical protein
MPQRYLLLLLFIVCSGRLLAQLHRQIDTATYRSKPIIPVDRAELLKRVDLIFNMQYANNNLFTNGQYTSTNYAFNQFRLEIIGEIFDSVFFRFRQSYTRMPLDSQTIDNTNQSIDMAFIDIKISSKFNVSFGKLSADFGGYEFEAPPIYIYQYNDIIAHADDFLLGAGVSWQISPKHSFGMQMLNARTESFYQLYDTIPGVSPSKFAAMIVTTWRGSFAHNKFNTIWSFTTIREARNEFAYYLALGNQLSLKKWLIQYDFKLYPEDLDRSNIVSTFVPAAWMPYRALKTQYLENWLHVEYSLPKRWRATATLYSSEAWWFGNPDPQKVNHLRTSYGVIPTIEWFPYKNLNLKFFTAYVGRFYDYTGYAQNKFGLSNLTTGVFEVGFISPLVVL